MVPTFRYIIKIIAILLLLPMKLFPINMKKILLLNDMAGNNPNYSGNIKYIIDVYKRQPLMICLDWK